MENSFVSLLPPIVAIGLAIATKRVVTSLGIGVVLGALLLHDFNVIDAVTGLVEVAGGLI